MVYQIDVNTYRDAPRLRALFDAGCRVGVKLHCSRMLYYTPAG